MKAFLARLLGLETPRAIRKRQRQAQAQARALRRYHQTRARLARRYR